MATALESPPKPLGEFFRREVWTVEDINRLLSVAASQPRVFLHSRLPRSVFFLALILLVYETRWPVSALFSLKWSDVGKNGRLLSRDKNNGRERIAYIRESTLNVLYRLQTPGRSLVLNEICGHDRMASHFTKMATAAGLKGGLKTLRHSAEILQAQARSCMADLDAMTLPPALDVPSLGPMVPRNRNLSGAEGHSLIKAVREFEKISPRAIRVEEPFVSLGMEAMADLAAPRLVDYYSGLNISRTEVRRTYVRGLVEFLRWLVETRPPCKSVATCLSAITSTFGVRS